MPSIQLLIYLEDAPLGDSVAGSGLSKAFNESLRSIINLAPTICVAQTHTYINPHYFISDCHTKSTFTASRIFWFFSRLIAACPYPPVSCFFANIQSFWLSVCLKRNTYGLNWQAVQLFSPVGTDYLTIQRAATLAKHLKCSYNLYLVDDLESHPDNIEKRSVAKVVKRCLYGSLNNFVITPGLRDVLYFRHGVDSKVISLAAPSMPILNRNIRSRRPFYAAFFCGSINHLYVDGLSDLIDIVRDLRLERGRDLKIRICSLDTQIRSVFPDLPPWVVTGVSLSDGEMLDQIASSAFCYLPYSFSERDRPMTETSFPSKLIQYLIASRAIVLYTPLFSVPAKLFLKNQLPFLAADKAELAKLIATICDEEPDVGARYQELIQTEFSSRAFRAVVVSSLNG